MTTTTGTSGSGTISTDLLNTLNAKKTTKTTDDTAASQDRFLLMLTTQLKNQDPLSPMDNSQMTSQLAQISTVDGISKVNATLQSMLGSYQSSEATQAAGLVGRGVLVTGSGLQLTQGQALGGIELTEPADKLSVSIVDSNGLEVRRLQIDGLKAGSHVFTWDGKTDAGVAAADGMYSIKLSATRGDTKVTPTALELGTVTSVVRGSTGVDLEVGKLGSFKVSDIKRILS